MNCLVMRLSGIALSSRNDIIESACKPGSDFQAKLLEFDLTDDDGWIAIVRHGERLLGWARTEVWRDKNSGEVFDTLEAFTVESWRKRGICQFAATGLLAAQKIDRGPVAIFSNQLVQTCRRMAVRWVLYENVRGEWEKIRD